MTRIQLLFLKLGCDMVYNLVGLSLSYVFTQGMVCYCLFYLQVRCLPCYILYHIVGCVEDRVFTLSGKLYVFIQHEPDSKH